MCIARNRDAAATESGINTNTRDPPHRGREVVKPFAGFLRNPCEQIRLPPYATCHDSVSVKGCTGAKHPMKTPTADAIRKLGLQCGKRENSIVYMLCVSGVSPREVYELTT